MFSKKIFNNLKLISRNFSLKTTTYKTSTGLVGLDVDYNARNTLLDLTSKCLQIVEVYFILLFYSLT